MKLEIWSVFLPCQRFPVLLVGFRILSSGIIIRAADFPSCSNNHSLYPWPSLSLRNSHSRRDFILLSPLGTQLPLLFSCVYRQLSLASKWNKFVSLLEKGSRKALVFHNGNLSFSACIFELLCSIAYSCCQEGFVFPKE